MLPVYVKLQHGVLKINGLLSFLKNLNYYLFYPGLQQVSFIIETDLKKDA